MVVVPMDGGSSVELKLPAGAEAPLRACTRTAGA